MTYLDDMTDAYITCALWSSTDQSDDTGGRPLDDHYGRADIAPASLASMREDCAAFERDAIDVLDKHAEVSAAQAGHDLWLTRNRHGAGFWDRGLGTLGNALTDAAHAFGESDLYVGDDGKLYVS